MKRHIISYWRPETVKEKFSEKDPVLRELEPYGRITLERNDEIWVVSVVRKKGELYLIGHITVGQLIKTHREKRYKIKAKQFTEEKLKYVSLTNEAEQFRFISKGTSDRLDLSRGRINAEQFASPRLVTEETAKLLIEKWSQAITKAEMMQMESEQLNSAQGFIGKSNPMVEEAAIETVIEYYEALGWKVNSVETENKGYDLVCKKGGKELHVEVKGLLGTNRSFILTANEFKTAKKDCFFCIAIVTHALSVNPRLEIHTGEGLFENFNFRALEYMVTPK